MITATTTNVSMSAMPPPMMNATCLCVYTTTTAAPTPAPTAAPTPAPTPAPFDPNATSAPTPAPTPSPSPTPAGCMVACAQPGSAVGLAPILNSIDCPDQANDKIGVIAEGEAVTCIADA